MKDESIIKGLNSLLEKNYDAERGFKNAADKTDNPVLAAFYRGKASNRNVYGHQIKDILRENNAEIQKGTSLKGDLHNTWINFKSVLAVNKEESILEEVERGEEACLEEYDCFLKENLLTRDMERIISYQRNNIANSLSSVNKYEEQFN